MENKFDVAREYELGFLDGISVRGFDHRKEQGSHWMAGYMDGHKLRSQKNELLNVYLESIGVDKIGVIVLCGDTHQ